MLVYNYFKVKKFNKNMLVAKHSTGFVIHWRTLLEEFKNFWLFKNLYGSKEILYAHYKEIKTMQKSTHVNVFKKITLILSFGDHHQFESESLSVTSDSL